jgi:hypothetical protein
MGGEERGWVMGRNIGSHLNKPYESHRIVVHAFPQDFRDGMATRYPATNYVPIGSGSEGIKFQRRLGCSFVSQLETSLRNVLVNRRGMQTIYRP